MWEGVEPGNVSRFALEEIWHEDPVFIVLVRGGKDVCSLNRLREVSKDVEDNEDSFGSIGRTGDIFKNQVSPALE